MSRLKNNLCLFSMKHFQYLKQQQLIHLDPFYSSLLAMKLFRLCINVDLQKIKLSFSNLIF